MSTPKFNFSLRDAASPATAKAFVELCISTGRFARNERGAVCWSPGPNDWIPIVRAAEFRSVLEDGDVLQITGDTNSDAYFTLWTFLNDRRWKLQRIGGAWNPPKPPGVAHVRYEAPPLNRPENAPRKVQR